MVQTRVFSLNPDLNIKKRKNILIVGKLPSGVQVHLFYLFRKALDSCPLLLIASSPLHSTCNPTLSTASSPLPGPSPQPREPFKEFIRWRIANKMSVWSALVSAEIKRSCVWTCDGLEGFGRRLACAHRISLRRSPLRKLPQHLRAELTRSIKVARGDSSVCLHQKRQWVYWHPALRRNEGPSKQLTDRL